MPEQVDHVLSKLDEVARLRRLVQADRRLNDCVRAVKAYQSGRFETTYSDLLIDPRYAAAARFFLDELYGPQDFERRDAQFARVAPTALRLFPGQLGEPVSALVELHALSESLDVDMARRLTEPWLDDAGYRRAWSLCGQPELRRRQIELTVGIGRSLDRLTRSAVLRTILRAMRRPARAAGLSELQHFLERGFESFAAMHGAAEFLSTVEQREKDFAHSMENSCGQAG